MPKKYTGWGHTAGAVGAERRRQAWSTRLAPFGVEPLGPTSADSPLKARLEEMRAAVAGAEELAREFVRGELEVLQARGPTARACPAS